MVYLSDSKNIHHVIKTCTFMHPKAPVSGVGLGHLAVDQVSVLQHGLNV